MALADSTGAQAPKSIETRIQELELFRDEVEDRAQRLREKAQSFRERAGGVA